LDFIPLDIELVHDNSEEVQIYRDIKDRLEKNRLQIQKEKELREEREWEIQREQTMNMKSDEDKAKAYTFDFKGNFMQV